MGGKEVTKARPVSGGPRKGAGRPPLDDPREVLVGVRLTHEEAAHLDTHRKGRPRAETLRKAARRVLR